MRELADVGAGLHAVGNARGAGGEGMEGSEVRLLAWAPLSQPALVGLPKAQQAGGAHHASRRPPSRRLASCSPRLSYLHVKLGILLELIQS